MKTGLVLSGGGARGIAHLGVLAALDELGIHITALSGTSAGAVVATLYAGGIAPARIREIVKESSYFGFFHLLLGKPGLFTMEALRRILIENLPGSCFEDLPVQVFVTATNLSACRPEIFSSGNLIEPVLASACLPVVYEPVRIGDSQYVDGGVLDNFPVEPLLPLCDRIIGSHVNRIATWTADTPFDKAAILDRCFHLAVAGTVYEKARCCHVFLDPPELEAFGLLDTRDADTLFDIGYRHCLTFRDRLLAIHECRKEV
jgi:NTE family protein